MWRICRCLTGEHLARPTTTDELANIKYSIFLQTFIVKSTILGCMKFVIIFLLFNKLVIINWDTLESKYHVRNAFNFYLTKYNTNVNFIVSLAANKLTFLAAHGVTKTVLTSDIEISGYFRRFYVRVYNV